MIKFTNQLYEAFSRELDAFSLADNETETAAQKLETALKYMEKLKSFISGYSFGDPKEEIVFFKKDQA